MKFNINNYKGNYLMRCTTEKEATIFCQYLKSVGKRWRYGDTYDKTGWDNNAGSHYYDFNDGWIYSEKYTPLARLDLEYNILNFSDFEWNEQKNITFKQIFNLMNMTENEIVEHQFFFETKQTIYSVSNDTIISQLENISNTQVLNMDIVPEFDNDEYIGLTYVYIFKDEDYQTIANVTIEIENRKVEIENQIKALQEELKKLNGE